MNGVLLWIFLGYVVSGMISPWWARNSLDGPLCSDKAISLALGVVVAWPLALLGVALLWWLRRSEGEP